MCTFKESTTTYKATYKEGTLRWHVSSIGTPGSLALQSRNGRKQGSIAHQISWRTSRPSDGPTSFSQANIDGCQSEPKWLKGVFCTQPNSTRERQAEGIVAARQRGAYRGQPPKIDMDAIRRRLAEGQSPTRIARYLGISRGTVYKAKGMAEAHEEPGPDM